MNDPDRTAPPFKHPFAFEFCMPKGWSLLAVFIFIVVCALVFQNFYSEAKRNAVRQLNEEQLIHARQAARGIEEYFATWTGILGSFGKTDEIIQTSPNGKRYMDLFYEGHKQQLSSVTRVDEKGTILYTVPFRESIGSNIAGQPHMREILEKHKPVISDVFRSVQGFDAVALHVPVFEGDQFKGTLAIVLNFQELSKRYLEVIKIGRTGRAWVVSRDGTELYGPVPGDVGKSIFAIYRNSPSILAMTREMLEGKAGAATYTYADKGRSIATDRHQAVYMPIELGNTFWSIVVVCSEKEVLSSLASFRNKLLLIIGIIAAGGVFFSAVFVKAWIIVAEEAKRKQVEEELRSSEARFHLLIEHAPDAIVMYDVDLDRFVEANAAAEKLFGCSRRELLQSAPHRFYAPQQPDLREVGESFVEHTGRVLAGENIQFERAIHSATGKNLLCEVRLVGLPYEKRRLIRASYLDITERKRTEKELVESERRFRMLFEQAAVGVAEIDAVSGRFLAANKRYCDIVGLSLHEMLSTDFQSITYPDDLPADLDAMKRLIADEIREYSMDKRYIRKNGDIVWVSLTVYPVWVSGQKPTHHIAIVEDITKRKTAEEELLKYRLHLEDLVNERTEELKAANDKLQELDRLKSMFIASMSHELRTPLNSIIGFTGMTLQGLSGDLNDEQKDNLSRAYNAARHLLSLITDVIDISKIEAGRIDSYPEVVSLDNIIDEAIGTVTPQLKEKQLDLAVQVPEGLLLNADRKRLLQCLLNFLSNAVKFTEKGTITVAAREADGQVTVSVADTGIGIAEKDMPKLFEAFERFETHLRVKAGGTGLGLYLTKKIAVEILRGEVFVQSREGQGSTFGIRVPKELRENSGPVERRTG